MSFKYEWTEFPVAGVSKLLATNGGAHIYNITLSTDAFNGAIIGRGDWLSFDNYSETTPTSISAIVREQAANGNWYVEIVSASNALFVYNPPVVEAEWDKDASAEKHFYLKAGVDVARAHELCPGDIVEVSANGFQGTPSKGATISSVYGKKMVIGAQGATGATGA